MRQSRSEDRHNRRNMERERKSTFQWMECVFEDLMMMKVRGGVGMIKVRNAWADPVGRRVFKSLRCASLSLPKS